MTAIIVKFQKIFVCTSSNHMFLFFCTFLKKKYYQDVFLTKIFTLKVRFFFKNVYFVLCCRSDNIKNFHFILCCRENIGGRLVGSKTLGLLKPGRQTNAPIGPRLKCNLPAFEGNYDRPTNHQIDGH